MGNCTIVLVIAITNSPLGKSNATIEEKENYLKLEYVLSNDVLNVTVGGLREVVSNIAPNTMSFMFY